VQHASLSASFSEGSCTVLQDSECNEVTGRTVAWSGKHGQGLGCVVQGLAPVHKS
jgi:hypothetical protein